MLVPMEIYEADDTGAFAIIKYIKKKQKTLQLNKLLIEMKYN